MKKNLFTVCFLLIFLLLLVSPSCLQLEARPSYNPQRKITYSNKLTKIYLDGKSIRNEAGPIFLVGCNVRGQAYNPKKDGRYDDWYTDRYLDSSNIQSYGFNAIRLITYWECIETSRSPSEFTFDDKYIEKIRETVEAYNKRNIYVIIDLYQHGSVSELSRFIPTLGSDSDFADEFYSDTSSTSAREHLKRLWLRLSETFKDNPGVAGYGICNEPHRSSGFLSEQEVANLWFEMADYVIVSLRANGDSHVIFVQFAPWSRYAGFMSRKLNDENVVYEIHFYYGIKEADLSVSNKDHLWLKEQFDTKVNAKMLMFGVPFVMGEQGFGGHQVVEGDARDIWLKNVIDIHRAGSLMQGWLYYCYIAYEGAIEGGGWQATLIRYFTDTPLSTPMTNPYQLTISCVSSSHSQTNPLELVSYRYYSDRLLRQEGRLPAYVKPDD